MLYKFKSKASGDVIMLGPNGDELLRVLGREPAPRGILEVAHMDDALARIEAALAAEQQAAQQAADEGQDEEAAALEKAHVALRQRLWPIVEMIRRSSEAGEPIVWGV